MPDFTCIWVTPARRYSTGSSMVMIFFSGELMRSRARIQGGGLAAAGGAGDQDHAVGLVDQLVELLQLPGRKTQAVQVQDDLLPVQDADDHALPQQGGEGGDPEIDVVALDLQAEAAVLGQPALGDVQAGHDLQAGEDRGLQPLGGRFGLVEDAVLAVAHPEGVLKGLQVDVAGPHLNGPEHQEVDQLDDGGLPGHIPEMADLGGLLRGQIQFFGLQVAHQPGHGAARLVHRLDEFQDLLFGRLDREPPGP